MTKKDALTDALKNALTACGGLQSALDEGDLDDATEWLEALSTDSTAALNEVYKAE